MRCVESVDVARGRLYIIIALLLHNILVACSPHMWFFRCLFMITLCWNSRHNSYHTCVVCTGCQGDGSEQAAGWPAGKGGAAAPADAISAAAVVGWLWRVDSCPGDSGDGHLTAPQ